MPSLRELDDLLASFIAPMIAVPQPELAATMRASLAKSVSHDFAWPVNVREVE